MKNTHNNRIILAREIIKRLTVDQMKYMLTEHLSEDLKDSAAFNEAVKELEIILKGEKNE